MLLTSGLQYRHDVRMDEVIAFEKQGQVKRACECVSRAIPEVQLRRMARTFPEALICIKGNCSLTCVESQNVHIEVF